MEQLYPILNIITPISIGVIIGSLSEWALKVLSAFVRGRKLNTSAIIVDSARGLPFINLTAIGVLFAIVYSVTQVYWVRVGTLAVGVLLMGSIALWAVRIGVDLLAYYASRRNSSMATTSILRYIIYLLIFVPTTLIVLTWFGVPTAPIFTAFAAGGLGLSLALQSPITNLFSGVVLAVSNKIRPGDFVRLSNGNEGTVVDINWYTTRILQWDNTTVQVPNSLIAQEHVLNFDQPTSFLDHVIELGVSYDSDLEHVTRVTLEEAQAVMLEHPGGVPDYECKVIVKEFADFSINLLIIVRVQHYLVRLGVQSALLKRLHVRYAQEGIHIPFPVHTIQFEHGHAPAEFAARTLPPPHSSAR